MACTVAQLMTGRGVTAAVLAALVLAVAGCSLAGAPARRFVDDATISSRVKARLVSVDPALATIDVDTYEGTVYLDGPVASVEMKRAIAELAAEVDDVELVVSNLHVPASRGGEGASGASGD
jgi:osmotically-inducible protein OsmY